MKTKPLSHKSQNTFKFQSFNQQIAQINVNASRLVGLTKETPDDAETFFHDALLKWNELNCTEAFANFKSELGVEFQTLPQLILNKNTVIECLKKHLRIPRNLAHSPLLELVVALTKDLQKDFYIHFPEFLDIFISLLASKDVEVIGSVFRTIAFLFQILRRCMVKDFKKIFRLYSGLLECNQPHYIKVFAAESIAYLLRKIPCKKDMLDTVFSDLREDVMISEGVGLALFEVVKNVQHQFHSLFEEVFYMVLLNLGAGIDNFKEYVWDEVSVCVDEMLSCMLKYTTPKFSSVIWKIFMKTLNELMDAYMQSSENNRTKIIVHLGRVMKLLSDAVAFENSFLFQWSSDYEKFVFEYLSKDDEQLLNECGSYFSQLIVNIFLSPHVQLSSTIKKNIISAMFESKHLWSIKWDVTRSLFSYSSFHEDVLPAFLQSINAVFCSNNNGEKDIVLASFAELIDYFCPFPLTGSELLQYKRLTQVFTLADVILPGSEMIKHLENTLKLQDDDNFIVHIPALLSAIICVPHVRRTCRSFVEEHLRDFCELLYDKVVHKEATENEMLLLFVAISTMLLSAEMTDIEEIISISEMKALLRQYPSNINCLRTFDLYVTFLKKRNKMDSCSSEVLEAILPYIESNLSSPQKEIRLTSLLIFKNFEHELMLECSKSDVEYLTVFDVCLKTENIELSIKEYRERIRILQYLDYQRLQSKSLKNDEHETISLQYLIGSLFEPFEPIWDPIVNLIVSYARGMDCNKFWKVFVDHLKRAAIIAENDSLHQDNVKVSVENVFSAVFKSIKEKLKSVPSRVDFAKHRELLWKSMLHFVNIAESKSRDMSPLLLNFMRNECNRLEMERSLSQNIERNEDCKLESQDILNGENNEENKSSQTDSDVFTRLKSPIKLLCAHLTVFSNFKNPKCIYLEPELRQLYFDLLSHPSSIVQKVALDCIMTYKYNWLLPYKDNLYRLLNEKTFKSEIILFNIDSELSVIQPEHRSEFMPFLIRILYGIIRKQQSKHSSGKDGFKMRRRIVLQYLANCKEEEFKTFLDLVFMPVQLYTEGDILHLVEDVFENLDFCNVIPLKKIESTLHHIEIILSKLGGRIYSYLPWIFKILICMTARVVTFCENRKKIHNKFWNHLKILRKHSLSIISLFFSSFVDYPYSSVEIDAFFNACVWPQLKRLPEEGIRNRSRLLNLFSLWSENSRFFPLLNKRSSECDTPLHQMMHLLSNESTDKAVIILILNIIKNLATLADYIPDEIDIENGKESGSAIEINDEFPITEYAKKFENCDEKPNYGSIILMPHILPILTRLQHLIESSPKRSKLEIYDSILTIMNRLSEFVEDGNYCATLVKLLIPLISEKFHRNEEIEIQIITTIKHLLKFAENPHLFLTPLSSLFSSLENRSSRCILCETVSVVSSRNDAYENCSKLVNKLNAWDRRRPEEPDYILRIEGFQESKNISLVDHTDPSYLLLVIYNCCYSIRTTNDLAIRDNASHCLQTIASKLKLISKSDVKKVSDVFLRPLLNEVRKDLRNKNETIRHEFVLVLATFVKECNNFSEFNELRILTNSDPEVDFFENIKHIQLHRRSRAMSKLAHSGILTQFNQKTLTQYVMPIISAFLFNEAYTKYNHLVDASIELIGKICQNLDWTMYEQFLRHYLDKITDKTEYQKMAVSVVVSILNGFHFDLTMIGNYTVDKLVAPPVQPNADEENCDEESEIQSVEEKDMDVSDLVETNCNKLGVEKALKIYKTISTLILPRLHNCITRKAAKDDKHRLAQHSEEDETLRVPVAIAMIKLLQRLPKGMLDTHLPGILMKLCSFLKSRLASVRQVARETLITIMETLGEKYLPYVIKEMRQLLTRGYQIHSMTYSIHAILRHMIPYFKPGCLDSCVSSLIKVYREELFGIVAEEKEVKEISGKLIEAKGTKAYDVYEILARFISYPSMLDLFLSLKEILSETTNHIIVGKVTECFKRITQGLVLNEAISFKQILLFSYEIINNSPQEKKLDEKTILDEKETAKMPSIFIVPLEPRRNKVSAPKSRRTNVHVTTNFGLEVLYFSLKRGKIETSSQEGLEMLDPFVELILKLLISSHHRELIISSLKIMSSILVLELPSIKKFIDQITKTLFKILNSYSDNNANAAIDVINTCFKTIIVVIRKVKCSTIEENHLKMLLVYVERDITLSDKQALAFNMFKAILSKKLLVPEIHELIATVKDMSIVSEVEHVRTQCRQCVLMYMLDYPLGKKVFNHLQFFIAQLKYEHESGRESAIEMLNMVCSVFPQDILDSSAASIFVGVANSLANDESAICGKMAVQVIKILFSKISANVKDTLFDMSMTWMSDKKIAVRKLGAQLCGVFAEIEKDDFKARLTKVLSPIITDMESAAKINSDEAKFDHLIIQILECLLKIVNNCNVIHTVKYKDHFDKIWSCALKLLLHPHAWVRYLCCQLFGFLFAACPFEEVVKNAESRDISSMYLSENLPSKIINLADNFCKQLKSSNPVLELIDQVAKNMIYLALVISKLPVDLSTYEFCDEVSNLDVTEEQIVKRPKVLQLSVRTIGRKLFREAQDEIINNSKIVFRRSCFFHFVAGVTVKLDEPVLSEILKFAIPVMLREINTDARFADESLKNLAQEVLEMIKEKVGLDSFSNYYALAQKTTADKKAKRKIDRAANAITNPQSATKRKIKKNIAKAQQKKRKMEYFQKGRPSKFRKL